MTGAVAVQTAFKWLLGRSAPRDMRLPEIDAEVAELEQVAADVLGDLGTARLGLLRFERTRRRRSTPARRLSPRRPAASDGALNVLEEVAARLSRQPEGATFGASQCGLHRSAVDTAITAGYLQRSDTGTPDTDGGRHRLHVTSEGRRQLRLDAEYRAWAVRPREDNRQLALWAVGDEAS